MSEHYNRRIDEAFKGLTNYKRIVDDVIIFDDNESNRVNHVRHYVQRCADKGIFLPKNKFKFCQPEVTFAGYKLSRKGTKLTTPSLRPLVNFLCQQM